MVEYRVERQDGRDAWSYVGVATHEVTVGVSASLDHHERRAAGSRV